MPGSPDQPLPAHGWQAGTCTKSARSAGPRPQKLHTGSKEVIPWHNRPCPGALRVVGCLGSPPTRTRERGIIVFGQGEDPQLRREGADAAETPMHIKQLGGICYLSPVDEPKAPQLPPRTAAFSPKIRHFFNGRF